MRKAPERITRALPALLCAGFLSLPPHGLAAEPPFAARAYYQLTYDWEVAAHCGLRSGAIDGAYKRTRARMERASRLDADALRAIRIQAIAAVFREYDNRGLGGHRQWCDTEGMEGVARMLAGDPEPAPPAR